MVGIIMSKASLDNNDGLIKMSLFAKSKWVGILSGLLLAFPHLLITGCVAPHPAPVVESQRNLNQPAQVTETNRLANKQIYVVQRGDTLYGIALKHNIDYRELAQWNGIVDPNALRIGQAVDLAVPSRQPQLSSHQEQQTATSEQISAAQPTLFSVSQPALTSGTPEIKQLSSAPQSDLGGSAGALVTEPKGVKLPYSETAVAQLSGAENIPPPNVSSPPKVETVAVAPTSQKIRENENIPRSGVSQKSEIRSSGIKWSWPTNGQVLSRYTEKSKGVSISGRPGQPVVASADGTVVYSGSGLRGYGNLIIVKHNDTYLSAYGHNSKILVREGETVKKGQKIAEMGNTDSDTVKLHFEIRERGKPVDPLQFLSD